MSRLNKRGYNYDPKEKQVSYPEKQGQCQENLLQLWQIWAPLIWLSGAFKAQHETRRWWQSTQDIKENSWEEKDHKKKGSFTRKEKVKAFLGEWITDGESSSDDSSDEESKKKIVGIAMHDDDDDEDGDEAPLPPPPMCFMARGNSKVSDDDDSSSDESEHCLSPNEVQNILGEYQQV